MLCLQWTACVTLTEWYFHIKSLRGHLKKEAVRQGRKIRKKKKTKNTFVWLLVQKSCSCPFHSSPQKGVQSDTEDQHLSLQCSSTSWQFKVPSCPTFHRYFSPPAGDETVDRASIHDRLVNPLVQETQANTPLYFLSGKVRRSRLSPGVSVWRSVL